MKRILLFAFVLAVAGTGCKKANCFECQLRYQSNNNEVPESVWPSTYIEGCDDTTESHLEANPIHIEDGGGNVIHDYYWDCK